MATEGYNKTAVSKIHRWFNPATTYLRLYQARIWISKSYVVVIFFLHFFISFCVQRVKVSGNSCFLLILVHLLILIVYTFFL